MVVGPGKRRLAAILSLDAVGFSRRMSQDESATADEIGRVFASIGELLQSHGGRAFGRAGDGVMADFDSVVNAVACAVAIQKSLEAPTGKAGQPGLQFRMGINVGDILVSPDGLLGDCINVAKRVEEDAQPSDIFVTRAVYDQTKNRIPVGFECIGDRRLKNIPDPVEVYRVLSHQDGDPRQAVARGSARQPEQPDRPSVAILPFDDMSPEKARLNLGDAISEEIIASLSRFHDLFVIARNSTFTYKGRPIRVQTIGQELGVRYVVEGSVRTTANRIRVTAQLIEAQSGVHIWADRFDEALTELFEVQDRIIGSIVGILRGRLERAEMARLRRARPEDLNIYGQLLQAKAAFHFYTRSSLEEAEVLCRKVLTLNAEYAPAWVLLSRIHNDRWRYGWTESREQAMEEALTYARRAIALDEADARAHAELAVVFLYQKHVDLALTEFEHALRINPNDADIMAEKADALVYRGRPREAIEVIEKAMRLNPYFPDWYFWVLAGAHFATRDYEAAVHTIYRMVDPSEGRRILAASYAKLGRLTEARAQVEQVLKRQPDFSIRAWAAVQPDMVPADLEDFVDGMRKAGFPE
jgi:TolB-like protein/class 3 adenylate cyclase/Flp pilus assembly protein TadD